MENVIVTRHSCVVEWLAQRSITGTVIAHAKPTDVSGKVVIGILPLHLAALAEKVITIDVPGLTLEQRKTNADLTPEQMDAAGAKLVAYIVRMVAQ